MRIIIKPSELKVQDVVVAVVPRRAGNTGTLIKGYQYKIISQEPNGKYFDIISEKGTKHECVKVADGIRFRHLYKNEAKRC